MTPNLPVKKLTHKEQAAFSMVEQIETQTTTLSCFSAENIHQGPVCYKQKSQQCRNYEHIQTNICLYVEKGLEGNNTQQHLPPETGLEGRVFSLYTPLYLSPDTSAVCMYYF